MWEEDGALWLNTKANGDPREKRVLRKSPDQGGDYTYLAGDLAYHRNKFQVRGFDRVINVWGADHQGQVASLRAGRGRARRRQGAGSRSASGRWCRSPAAASASGWATPSTSTTWSTTSGPTSCGCCRWWRRSTSRRPSTSTRCAASRGKSPVFYVQYAHARIHSIGKKAGELGVVRADLADVDLAPLTHEREVELLRTLSTLPEVVELACNDRAPHKVTAWVRELADRFHGFYHDCRILGDEVPAETTQARLWLVEASRIGFAVGLDLLGVAAPESM